MAENEETPNAEEKTEETTEAEKTAAAAEAERQFEPFTPKQQAKLNAVINETTARSHVTAKKEWEPKLTAAQATIADLQKQLEGKKPAVPDPKVEEQHKEPEDVIKLRSQIEEIGAAAKVLKQERDELSGKLQSQESLTKETRVKEAFLQAATKVDFYDAMDVFSLVRNDIAIDKDSGRIVILNPSGNAKLNSDLEPMTLLEYLGDFAKTKPHMVKAKNAEGGTGAGPSRVETPREKTKDFSKMTQDEFRAYTNKVISQQG